MFDVSKMSDADLRMHVFHALLENPFGNRIENIGALTVCTEAMVTYIKTGALWTSPADSAPEVVVQFEEPAAPAEVETPAVSADGSGHEIHQSET